MKKLIIALCLLIIKIPSWGETFSNPIEVVKKYGNIIEDWCKTKKEADVHSLDLEQLTIGNNFRIIDEIISDWIKERNIQEMPHYELSEYTVCLKNIIDEGSMITVTDVRYENPKYSNDSELNDRLYYVSCRIIVSGEKDYDLRETFYLRRGNNYKIARVGPYEELVDEQTGKKEVIVDTRGIEDWDGLLTGDYNSIEASYGYSEHFPLNIGLSASISYFNIGVEFGKSFTDTPLYFKKHTNFATSTIEGGYYYFMISPGIFLRYASVDCGVGSLISTYKYESVYSFDSEKKSFFMMKPKVTLNIPIPINYSSKHEIGYLCPHIGYQYVPDFPDLNCWEIGLGVRFRFNTY